jgi:hypothetical protein
MFFAAPVTVALILGVVVYALPASGSSTSLISRVAKLEAQTKALKTQNTKLTKQVKALNAFVNGCLTTYATISLVGDPASGIGYVFTTDNNATETLAPALVPTAQGATPDFIAAGYDAKCISSTKSASAFSASRVGSLRPLLRH